MPTTITKGPAPKLHIRIEINSSTSPEDSADTLLEIADALAELHKSARAVLRASGRDDAYYRADAYWLGRFMDPHAEDGCDGIYGSVRDLESDDEDDE
jgi:hypothetical protein